MISRLLNAMKRWLRRSAVRPVLERAGLVTLGRTLLARRVARSGHYETVLLGRRLRFVATTPEEIVSIDGMMREETLLRRLTGSLRRGDVLYDVGANLGATAEAGKTIVVHAFEPEPGNADHLRRNVALNGVADRVNVHELALSDTSGRSALHGGGQEASIVSAAGAGRLAVEIEVARGAHIARTTGTAPRIVKIDVEGAEMQVLEGMHELFDDGTVREAFVEVHPDRLEAAGSTAETLEAWFHARGYRCVWSEPRGGEVHRQYRFHGAGAASGSP